MRILLYTFYNRWGLCSRVVWELTKQDVASIQLRTQSIVKDDVSKCRNHSVTFDNFLQLDRYYVNGLNGVKGLLNKIEKENYDFIIGLGDYRKNAKKIRFETKFINKYGRNKILEEGDEFYFVDNDLLNKFVGTGLKQVSTEMQISETTTNGPCNRSAYLVLNLIKEQNLNVKFLFLHIPRKMDLDCVICVIQNLFLDLE